MFPRSSWLLIACFGCTRAPSPPVPKLACPAARPSGGPDTTIYDARAVSQGPVRVSGPLPEYPPSLRRSGVGGSVVIEIVIDTLGLPDSTTVKVTEATDLGFVQPSIDAIEGTKFTPALLCGRPVRARIHVPMRFTVSRQWMSGTPPP